MAQIEGGLAEIKKKKKKTPGGEAKENRNVPGLFCAEGDRYK
jgi:hypothetical protein